MLDRLDVWSLAHSTALYGQQLQQKQTLVTFGIISIAAIVLLALGSISVSAAAYVYPPSTGYPFPHDEFGRPSYAGSSSNSYSPSSSSNTNTYANANNGYFPPSVGYPAWHSYLNPYRLSQAQIQCHVKSI